MTEEESRLITELRETIKINARYLKQIQAFHAKYQFHQYKKMFEILDHLQPGIYDYDDIIPPWLQERNK